MILPAALRYLALIAESGAAEGVADEVKGLLEDAGQGPARARGGERLPGRTSRASTSRSTPATSRSRRWPTSARRPTSWRRSSPTTSGRCRSTRRCSSSSSGGRGRVGQGFRLNFFDALRPSEIGRRKSTRRFTLPAGSIGGPEPQSVAAVDGGLLASSGRPWARGWASGGRSSCGRAAGRGAASAAASSPPASPRSGRSACRCRSACRRRRARRRRSNT